MVNKDNYLRFCVVELLSPNTEKPLAKKPNELRGVKMLESFKVNETAGTIQVFKLRSDVYVKDNSYKIKAESKVVCSSSDDRVDTKTYRYGIPGWFKFYDMANRDKRPLRDDFVRECKKKLGVSRRQGTDIKWESIYDNVVRIVDKYS